MTVDRWECYLLVAQSVLARSWLDLQANLGRALNTVAAYGRWRIPALLYRACRRLAQREPRAYWAWGLGSKLGKEVV